MNRRYVPDLPEQNALSEANFLRLEKLLGGLKNSHYDFQWFGRNNEPVQVHAEIIERFKFTSTVNLIKQNSALPKPMDRVQLTIRMYHDARMAEVVTWDSGRQLSGVYPYPNDRMYQIDEKAQANVFLGEWLAHLLRHGVAEREWTPS
ncbi:DUF1249 domain-containing protein [Saccharospirillum salsuginis]|nr:DUF1249 domain-containing protein [Saccharospirillum salsuginis]